MKKVATLVRENFFFSSRRRHTRSLRDWSSDVCSSDLHQRGIPYYGARQAVSTTNHLERTAPQQARTPVEIGSKKGGPARDLAGPRTYGRSVTSTHWPPAVCHAWRISAMAVVGSPTSRSCSAFEVSDAVAVMAVAPPGASASWARPRATETSRFAAAALFASVPIAAGAASLRSANAAAGVRT